MNVRIRLPTAEALRRVLVLAAVGAILGVVIPLGLLPDGVARYAEGSPERRAAESARAGAVARTGGLGRLAYLHARVEEVRAVPYHCADESVPAEARPLAVAIRYYSWFGIPAGRVYAGCGGGDVGAAAMPRSRPEDHPVVGRWTLARQRCPGVCAMTPDQALAMLGRVARYAVHEARFHDTACGPVEYVTRTESADAFAGAYGTTADAIGLAPGSVTVVEVRCDGEPWAWPGGRVALVGPDRALLTWDGVFFDLVRTDEPAPADALAVDEDECVLVRAVAPTLVAFFGLPEEGEEEQVTPQPGLEGQVAEFRRQVAMAGERLEGRGIRVVPVYGTCVLVAAPDGEEVFRARALGSDVAYLARGLGVRATLAGPRDGTAVAAFALEAFGSR